jgi:hypothetical protein
MGYTRGGVLPAGLTIFGRRQWSEAALLNQGRSISENARALALLNMASSDSLVASFYNKYHYDFWRAPLLVSRAIPRITRAAAMARPRSFGASSAKAATRSR